MLQWHWPAKWRIDFFRPIHTGSRASGQGGAIYGSRSVLSIEDSQFFGCSAVRGGAIFAFPSALMGSSCLFTNNTASTDGGAVYTLSTGMGGVFGLTQDLDNCRFFGNRALGNGGAVYGFFGNATITNCVFESNTAGLRGGAVSTMQGSTLTFGMSSFLLNQAGSSGGAILSSLSTIKVATCTFTGNSAPNGNGGAVSLRSSAMTFGSCVFSNNSAGIGGGALSCLQSSLGLSLFMDNCVFESNQAECGGAMLSDDCLAQISNSNFVRNVAISQDPTLSISGCVGGGAVAFSLTPGTLTDVVFQENLARSGNGGAIWYYFAGTLSTFHVQGSRTSFLGNSAPVGGGGVFYWSTPLENSAPASPLLLDCAPCSNPSNAVGNIALFGNELASMPMRLVVREDRVSNQPQPSREIVTSRLSFELRDFYDQQVFMDALQTFVSLVEPNSLVGVLTKPLVNGTFLFQSDFVFNSRPNSSVVVSVVIDLIGINTDSLKFGVEIDVCRAGKFNSADACLKCSRGRFSNVSAASDCEACPRGTYQPVEGQGSCLCAQPGQYVPNAGQITFQDCPRGTSQSLSCADKCEPCSPGRFSNQVGSAECSLCLDGKYSNNQTGFAFCSSCDSILYARVPLSDVNSGGRVVTDCVACPSNAICDGSTRVIATQNNWLSFDADGFVALYECPPDMCLANSECGAGREPASENPLCGKCQAGLSNWGGACVECDGQTEGRFVAMFLVLFVFVLLLFFFVRSSGSSERSLRASSVIVKISLYFIQNTVLMVDFASIAVLRPFNFDLFNSHVCWSKSSETEKLILPFLAPVASLLILAVGGAIHWSIVRLPLCKRKCLNFSAGDYVLTFVALMLFTYNRVAETALVYLNCMPVVYNGETIRLVRAAPAVNCDDSEYKALLPITIIIFILHVFLFPVLLLVFLWRVHRRSGKDKETALSPIVLQLSNFLMGSYGDHAYYWESFSLFRRVLLVSVVVFNATNYFVKYSWLSVLCFVFLIVHIVIRPFFEADSSAVSGASTGAWISSLRRYLVSTRPSHSYETLSLTSLTVIVFLLNISSSRSSASQTLAEIVAFSVSAILLLILLIVGSFRLCSLCSRNRGFASATTSNTLSAADIDRVESLSNQSLPSASSVSSL